MQNVEWVEPDKTSAWFLASTTEVFTALMLANFDGDEKAILEMLENKSKQVIGHVFISLRIVPVLAI